MRAVEKEALRAGIGVMEDVENNTLFREAVKTRLKESGGNLKRKAKENINNLKGSGYKTSTKIRPGQFPFGGHDARIAKSGRSAVRKRRQAGKKKEIIENWREKND
ncbi:hypothetical protein P5V15_012739 [Pogonomyrmex californicus]